MITTSCRCGCGVTFQQPEDPGRYREYVDSAHKQRAYRRRNPGRSHSGTRYESARARRERLYREAWEEEQARKERERQRAKARRGHSEAPPTSMPTWVFPTAADTALRAKKRRRCYLLFTRALHGSTTTFEAEACRQRAEEIRAEYGL